MKKLIETIIEVIAILVGADSNTRREAVAEGICDYSGQGRNKYGR